MDEGERDRKSRLVEFLSYPFIALLVLWIQIQALRALLLPTSPKRARSGKERPTRQQKEGPPSKCRASLPDSQGITQRLSPQKPLADALGVTPAKSVNTSADRESDQGGEILSAVESRHEPRAGGRNGQEKCCV
jgi:hypothetical protein